MAVVVTTREKGAFRTTRKTFTPMPFMEDYLLEMEVNGSAPDYIRKIRVALSYFADFCKEAKVEHPEEIARPTILRFQAWLGQQKLAKSTQQQQMKYLRGWVNWLYEARMVTGGNPWHAIRVGRSEKKPDPLSDAEVEALFAAHRQGAFSVPPFLFHRRETILVLLFAWGLRIHELHALTVTGMDTRLDFVQCRNKGGGTKTLPYEDGMKQVINRWLRWRANYARAGIDALLIDQRGNPISIGYIRDIIVNLGRQAGYDIHPHQLRDTCATTLLNNDVALERVAQIMGHTNLRQTLAYTRINNESVARDHSRVMTPTLDKLVFRSTRELANATNTPR
jgi:type 1 fimbriae regulatory protein FimB